MTLLDAPSFNEASYRRRRQILWGTVGALFVLFIAFWFAAGRPVDWPWHWWMHLRGRSAVNSFFKDVEKNDMVAAYGVWMHDENWQQHKDKLSSYTFDRFQEDWSPSSNQNEYGPIKSHEIVAARTLGNVMLLGIRVNGMKSKAVFLNYDPNKHQLGFSPVELYLGP
jgi:hypothetical protein